LASFVIVVPLDALLENVFVERVLLSKYIASKLKPTTLKPALPLLLLEQRSGCRTKE
jgi:hypothetical protein